jgi:threonine dehydrogenase-like Zn-dependent dehydrogenase
MDPVFPRSGGYSSAGVIEAVGEGVTDLKIGDRVALSWSFHGQMLNIDQNLVYKLEDSVSFEDAALFHISIFPLAAIRKCRLEIGESAMVMGMGVLGLVSLKLLRQAGAAPIIAVDPMAEKREKALKCGADYALDPFAEDFAKTVKELTGGGVKVAIEVTGVGKALDGVLDCMAKFGRVALLGCSRSSDFTIDYYRKVHGPGITLVGAHTAARPREESAAGLWTERDDALAVLSLVKHGRLSLASLVEEVHSPLEAQAVYTRLANERSFPVVEFDWSGVGD